MGATPNFSLSSQMITGSGAATFDLSSLGGPANCTYTYGITGVNWNLANQIGTLGVNLSANVEGNSLVIAQTVPGNQLTTPTTTVAVLATTVQSGIYLCVQPPMTVLTTSPPAVAVNTMPMMAGAMLSGFMLTNSDSGVLSGMGAGAGATTGLSASGAPTLTALSWGMLQGNPNFDASNSTVTPGLIACTTNPVPLGLSLGVCSLGPNGQAIDVTMPGVNTFAKPSIVAFLQSFSMEASETGNVSPTANLQASTTNLTVSGGSATGTMNFTGGSGNTDFTRPMASFLIVCIDAAAGLN